jgi:hypothetical protein
LQGTRGQINFARSSPGRSAPAHQRSVSSEKLFPLLNP